MVLLQVQQHAVVCVCVCVVGGVGERVLQSWEVPVLAKP